ncbi:MAG TPA: O-methyltransferase [Bacteroidetes bacterium]|nr:O-methyltransferase [Bacteroidota bacterium]
MLTLPHDLKHYIETHSTAEDPVLEELSRRTWWETIYPQMMSGTLQGKLLEFISRMITPERILEIGTFTGYSAICMARGLKNHGKLITIENNDELLSISKEFFDKAGLTDKIELIHGNALEIIPTLKDFFDLVFIDAEKTEYADYYKTVMKKVRSGGWILADNVLWDGKVIGSTERMDAETHGIRRFNELVKNDPGVEQIILPLRDGIMLIRKK